MDFIPNTDRDREKMLGLIGKRSMDELFAEIPAPLRFKGDLRLPAALSELELWSHMERLAAKNTSTAQYNSFLGAGAYEHFIPSAVRHILGRSEFYTAYTPYQAEISQGMLQSIYEYQSLMCELTGMDVTNASMYDGATAVAEAALMAVAHTGRGEVLVSRAVHPEHRQVLETYLAPRGLAVREVPLADGQTDKEMLARLVGEKTAGVIVQQPNFFGCVEDVEGLAELAHHGGAVAVVATNPVTLGVLKAPGEQGADIVIGEGQPLGNSLSFGGPYLGFMGARSALVRRLPGRIVGATVDRDGRRGYVLTLQTREQHIRREKATSNICSNQALNALAATAYLSMVGKNGLRRIGELCLAKAHYAWEKLTALPGVTARFGAPFFDEFAVALTANPAEVNRRLLDYQIIGGFELGRFYPEYADSLLVCVTEVKGKEDIDHLAGLLGGLL